MKVQTFIFCILHETQLPIETMQDLAKVPACHNHTRKEENKAWQKIDADNKPHNL